MGVIIKDKKLVIIAKRKVIQFDLPKHVNSNLKDGFKLIIKYNRFAAEHTIKNEISRLLSKYKPGNDIHEHAKQ